MQYILFLVVTIIALLPIIFYKQFNELHIKFPYILRIVAFLFLVYFLAARYIPDIVYLFTQVAEDSKNVPSIAISKVLLLDMCPLLAMILPISVIFNRRLVIAKILSPMAIIGALITLYGQAIWVSSSFDAWTFQYVFAGIEPNRLYFMMHLMSLFLGITVLTVSPAFRKRDCYNTITWLVIWLIYVLIFSSAFKVDQNITGLAPYDWESIFGQYHVLYRFWPIPFPGIIFFWYPVAVLFNYLIIFSYHKNRIAVFGEKNSKYVPPEIL